MQKLIPVFAFALIACQMDTDGQPDSAERSGDRRGDLNPNDDANPDDNNPDPADLLAPGSECDCSDQCGGSDANPGICVLGICMQQAAAACSAAGSQSECDTGSRCWGVEGLQGAICWPDCDRFNCDGSCDGDGSCVPTADTDCDASCSDFCRASMQDDGGDDNVDACASVTCPEGQLCNPSTGQCMDTDQNLPAGSPPDCAAEVPAFNDCDPRGGTNSCAELIRFDPVRAHGYWDYPLNGETEADQYRSWARRDLMMMVRRATAATECLSRDWSYQAYMELGLGDMSEENGAIPGTRDNEPGHPQGTHTNGHDMDIAYYQVGQRNNWLRSVCEHRSGGRDQYHCVDNPGILDVYRTALFIGRLHDTPYLRVIGVDGRVGPLVVNALQQLCGAGWLRNSACRQPKLAFEVTDEGRGWFRFHHHHLHISLAAPTRGW